MTAAVSNYNSFNNNNNNGNHGAAAASDRPTPTFSDEQSRPGTSTTTTTSGSNNKVFGEVVLELREIGKSFPIDDGKDVVHALKNVSISDDLNAAGRGFPSIRQGEFVMIRGPSGGGKTTLLNIIGTIDLPTQGVIKLLGSEITKDSEDDFLSMLRLRHIGFVFQTFNLLSTMSALENVELPMTLLGELSEKERRSRAKKLLALVGLRNRIHHLPSELSGGEQQRVTIARALANNPSILLLDEATGDLDTATTIQVMDLLAQINCMSGVTCIMVTHNPDIETYADRILYVEDGRFNRQVMNEEPLPLVRDEYEEYLKKIDNIPVSSVTNFEEDSNNNKKATSIMTNNNTSQQFSTAEAHTSSGSASADPTPQPTMREEKVSFSHSSNNNNTSQNNIDNPLKGSPAATATAPSRQQQPENETDRTVIVPEISAAPLPSRKKSINDEKTKKSEPIRQERRTSNENIKTNNNDNNNNDDEEQQQQQRNQIESLFVRPPPASVSPERDHQQQQQHQQQHQDDDDVTRKRQNSDFELLPVGKKRTMSSANPSLQPSSSTSASAVDTNTGGLAAWQQAVHARRDHLSHQSNQQHQHFDDDDLPPVRTTSTKNNKSFPPPMPNVDVTSPLTSKKTTSQQHTNGNGNGVGGVGLSDL